MATGQGWTSRLLTGWAEDIAAAGLGVWRPTGVYQANETGIVIRAVPDSPDRLITLAAYPLGTDLQGMADHQLAVQVRIRAGTDPRDCDDLADAIHDRYDSATGLRWGDIPIVQLWRQSYTSLGDDTNGRWSRSENYYIEAMRPTAHRTD